MAGQVIRLAIRGWGDGTLIFDERLDLREDDPGHEDKIQRLAEGHAMLLTAISTVHMIEIEFLDELKQDERFYRFGTDPSMMVAPLLRKVPYD